MSLTHMCYHKLPLNSSLLSQRQRSETTRPLVIWCQATQTISQQALLLIFSPFYIRREERKKETTGKQREQQVFYIWDEMLFQVEGMKNTTFLLEL